MREAEGAQAFGLGAVLGFLAALFAKDEFVARLRGGAAAGKLRRSQ